VEKLPAATVAVGWNLSGQAVPIPGTAAPFSPHQTTSKMRRLAQGTNPDAKRPKIKRPQRFGEYLLATGHVSADELRAAVAYHRARQVRVGEAIVELGYVTEASVEWAAHSFHTARKRHQGS